MRCPAAACSHLFSGLLKVQLALFCQAATFLPPFSRLIIQLFSLSFLSLVSGADGSATLYEDDGVSLAYETGDNQRWQWR
jgi:hypothetical protein